MESSDAENCFVSGATLLPSAKILPSKTSAGRWNWNDGRSFEPRGGVQTISVYASKRVRESEIFSTLWAIFISPIFFVEIAPDSS